MSEVMRFAAVYLPYVGALVVLLLLFKAVVIVGGTQIAVVERKYFGKSLPQGRVIALTGEIGIQARTLGPGLHLLIPFLYAVNKLSFTNVLENEVGLLESIDGDPVPPGKIFAKVVSGHNSFQDGEQFLKSGGQKGPQIEILPPGTYRINTDLFRVEIQEATVIPAMKIGLVTALDGEPMPEKEYVAKPVSGHSDFQDASKFLEAGGQRGPQFDALKPGTYYINPLIFKVDLDDVAVVERGQVAILVSNVGEEPAEIRQLVEEAAQREGGASDGEPVRALEDRLDVGIERYVVPKGFRGIQQEVAGPGVYYLNRRAYMAYVVDTTNITIDWDDSKETRFDPLKVISRDGFQISVSVKVVIRVRPDQAPYMVAKIGSIENLILHVIHPMIDSSFRNQASSTSAMNFMQDRQEEQRKAEERAKNELEKYHVECVSVLICQISLPQDPMDTQTKKIIGQQGVTAIEIAKQIASGNVKVTPDLLVQGSDGVGGLLAAYLTNLVTAKARPGAPAGGAQEKAGA